MNKNNNLLPIIDEQEVQNIREDFPILNSTMNSKKLIYFDSASTTQKPNVVLNGETNYYKNYNSGVDRSIYKLSNQATELYERARLNVANFFGVKSSEIIWTSNATESINCLTYIILNISLMRSNSCHPFSMKKDSEILITELEHHANLVPWQELCKKLNLRLRYIPINNNGTLNIKKALNLGFINENTKIIAFSHISNVLGIVNPVKQIVKIANKINALTVLDACQSAPHIPLNLKKLNVDFAAISGHKMLAPTGIGCLYGKEDLLKLLPPFLYGGSMIKKVSILKTQFQDSIKRFEAGTKQISQAIALSYATKYLKSINMFRIKKREQFLSQVILNELSEIPEINVLGASMENLKRISLVSFFIQNIHSHDVGQYLDNYGIAVRVGHHCAQPLHNKYGLNSSIRISTYIYNTLNEVKIFIQCIKNACSFFKKYF